MREKLMAPLRLMRRSRRARDIRDVLLFALLVAGGLWFVYYGTAGMVYHWQWYELPEFLVRSTDTGPEPGLLVQGLLLTLQLSAVALVCALVIGLVTTLMRLSGSWVASRLARVFLETVRNTPLLTQIYLIYFVLANVFSIPRFVAAVASLSLFEGAYMSEIMRAGITAIPRGQWEAAHSLGLSRWQTYRRIILPQALRQVLPPLTGQSVSLVKDSSLLMAIGILELTKSARSVVADTWMIFEVWALVAAMYLALTLSLSALSHWLERRMQTSPAGAAA